GGEALSRRELWDIILHLVNDEGLTVLLSTSYLDEAERCGHIVVLHSGRVLAQGTPATITDTARSRAFVAEPPTGQTARAFQARLLQNPTGAGGVPNAGGWRTGRAAGAGRGWLRGPLGDARVKRVPPRFEDAFMVLLRQAVEEGAASIAQPGEPHPQLDDRVVV